MSTKRYTKLMEEVNKISPVSKYHYHEIRGITNIPHKLNGKTTIFIPHKDGSGGYIGLYTKNHKEAESVITSALSKKGKTEKVDYTLNAVDGPAKI